MILAKQNILPLSAPEWTGKRMELSLYIEADFLAQIFASDHIAVQTAVSEIGTKSFHLIQRVIDVETGEVKCICTSVMVAFDLDKHESKALTEEWIDAICKYEGRDVRKKRQESKD